MSSALPSSWATAHGSELFAVLRGVSFKKGDATRTSSNNWIAILRAGNLQNGEILLQDLIYVSPKFVANEQFLRPGDLVIAMSSGSSEIVGKASVVVTALPNTSFGAFCGCVRPVSDKIFGWLRAYFSSLEYRRKISALAKGVNINNLKPSHLDNLLIPLPPFAEQRRIVAKVEALMTRSRRAKEALAAIRPLIERYRQAVLAAAFRGDLTADWRDRNLVGHSADEAIDRLLALRGYRKTRRGVLRDVSESDVTSLWTAPKTWTKRSIGNLLHCGVLFDVKDGNHGELHPKASEFSGEGMPFITAANVREGVIDYEGSPKISGDTLARLKIGFSKPGDVVLTHKGTVGRVAVNTQDCVLTPQTTYYRLNTALIRPLFLRYFMESPLFSDQTSRVMSQTTRNFVPISEQYRLFVALAPVEEQQEIEREIARRLEAMGTAFTSVGAARERLARLDQSILAKAFRGGLVPQDPNDEPASLLLDRIRAERAAAPQQKRGSRRKGATKMPSRKKGERRPLVEVLAEQTVPITPEQLFQMAGFVPEQVDDFYAEIKDAVDAGRMTQDSQKRLAMVR